MQLTIVHSKLWWTNMGSVDNNYYLLVQYSEIPSYLVVLLLIASLSVDQNKTLYC